MSNLDPSLTKPVFIVCQTFKDDESRWELQGIFSNLSFAADAVNNLNGTLYFIGAINIDKAFPKETVQWKDDTVWWPKLEDMPESFALFE
jgi:hypothetical protein